MQRAIDGLPGYTMPGMDGFTTDYFKVMTAVREPAPSSDEERPPHPFATLLGEAFQEVVQRPEGLPPEMAEVGTAELAVVTTKLEVAMESM